MPKWLMDEVEEYDMDLAAQPATVLDIGANVGAFTAWAAQRWPACEIVAYEPVRANADAFEENCRGARGVMLHRQAVRSFTGEGIMRTGGAGGARCSFHFDEDLHGREPVHCIDAATIPSAEFVKIDAEGCEFEIISRLDLSITKALACEYHLGDGEKIQKILQDKGFQAGVFVTDDNCGIIKAARPGAITDQKTWMIPDSALFSGRVGEKTVQLPAGMLRNPFYRPELAGKRLFIGLPVYSQAHTIFVQCLLALQAQKPCPIQVQMSQGDGVARSRNQLTAEFLKTNCTHLLFIDSDLIFSADQIAHLLNRNLPLIGGFYPKKQEGPLEWVINTLPGCPQQDEKGLQPLKYVGTGFMLIAREVFEKMIEHYPEIRYKADYGTGETQWDFWSMGVYRKNPEDEGRYLSEDWYFCQRWLDMGGEVFGDTSVIIKHMGMAIYPLVTQQPEITNPKRPEPVESSDSAAPQMVAHPRGMLPEPHAI